jgi:hypothetical protein
MTAALAGAFVLAIFLSAPPLLRCTNLLRRLRRVAFGGGREAPPPRFHVPWDRVPHARLLTLRESGYRLLYSAFSDRCGDGLGHSLSTFNAEIATALALGLTYSHRKASFGSLTEDDPNAIEQFFGLGDGEIPRRSVQENLCDIAAELLDGVERTRGSRVCPVCERLRNSSALQITAIVPLPAAVSFPGSRRPVGCVQGEGVACAEKTRSRLVRREHTLYHMTTDGCDKLAAHSDFSGTCGCQSSASLSPAVSPN